MKNLMQWVLAATLICGTSVFTSCSSDNDDNPVPESGANGDLVGKWYSDVSGATYAAWTFGKAWQQTEFNADGTGTTSIYYLTSSKNYMHQWILSKFTPIVTYKRQNRKRNNAIICSRRVSTPTLSIPTNRVL